jgi:hypothetical protein
MIVLPWPTASPSHTLSVFYWPEWSEVGKTLYIRVWVSCSLQHPSYFVYYMSNTSRLKLFTDQICPRRIAYHRNPVRLRRLLGSIVCYRILRVILLGTVYCRLHKHAKEQLDKWVQRATPRQKARWFMEGGWHTRNHPKYRKTAEICSVLDVVVLGVFFLAASCVV